MTKTQAPAKKSGPAQSKGAMPSTRPGSRPVLPPAAPAKPLAPLTPDQRQKLEQVAGGLDMLQEDTSLPRNIRRGAEEAKALIWNETLALDVRKSNAIGILDELANDPNIPLHGRTLIWSIMSQLEPIS